MSVRAHRERCSHGRLWVVSDRTREFGRYVPARAGHRAGFPPPGVPDKLKRAAFRCPCRRLGLA